MRWRGVAFLLALLLTAGTGDALAQASEGGARVRVTLRRPADRTVGEEWQRTVIGNALAANADSLVVALDPAIGTVSVPLSGVRRIEMSLGVPGRGASAFQRGFGGALFGAILGSLYNLAFEKDDSVSVGDSALEWGGVLGAWGFVTGAIAPEERWRRVRWEQLRTP